MGKKVLETLTLNGMVPPRFDGKSPPTPSLLYRNVIKKSRAKSIQRLPRSLALDGQTDR